MNDRANKTKQTTNKNQVRIERGIKGLMSGVFMKNFHNQYYDQVWLYEHIKRKMLPLSLRKFAKDKQDNFVQKMSNLNI